jgi:hypothetical protein
MKLTQDSFFAEEIDPRVEARALALEVICRLLLWMADAPSLEDRGLRTSVALFVVRPGLVDGETLEQIGEKRDGEVGLSAGWQCVAPALVAILGVHREARLSVPGES